MPDFTVPDRIKALRLEATNEFSSAAGAAVRNEFLRLHGGEITRDLRTKTNGGGSHCFAIYPIAFQDTADEVIAALAASWDVDGSRQGDLGF